MRNVNNGVGNEVKQGLYHSPLTLMSNRVAMGDQAWLDHMFHLLLQQWVGVGEAAPCILMGQSPCVHTADLY